MKKNKDIQIAHLIVKPTDKILLALGLVFVSLGILIITLIKSLHTYNVLGFRSFISVSFGAFLFYLSLIHIKKTGFFFLGLLFQLLGFLFVLIDLSLIPCTFFKIWPIILVFSGICLFITNFYKQSRVIKQFLVPSILVFFLGIVFLMFSLDLFPFTFFQFVIEWWPLFIIIVGIILVFLFFINKRKVPVE